MRGLKGKIALVAGGGAIGSATALRLAEEGCDVALGDISLDQAASDAREIADKTGRDVRAFAYDQGDEASIKALIEATMSHFGRLDFLHANAAELMLAREGHDKDILATDMAVFDRTMEVNLRGFVLCTRYALPHLTRPGGAIVYTGSGAPYLGDATRFSYGVSKTAIPALMRHVATRWGPEGIRANVIAPGFVMGRRDPGQLPPGFMDMVIGNQRIPVTGEGRHIAAMVAHLFSNDGEWITGQVISIDGGSTLRA